MNYSCTKCNVEKGWSARLVEDEKSKELVCTVDPKHRFKVGKNGFLESVQER